MKQETYGTRTLARLLIKKIRVPLITRHNNSVISRDSVRIYLVYFIQFVILEDFIKPSSPRESNSCKRNFKNFERNKLKEDFYKIDWDKVIHENDNNINDAFNSFYKTLTEILDHHAPLIKITKKERTLHLKP